MQRRDHRNGKKYCPKCETWYPATLKYFYKDKHRWDGLTDRCKQCRNGQHDYWVKAASRQQRQKIANGTRAWRVQLRWEVLCHYGGTPPKCACCGEDHLVFLVLDHVNGNGCKLRRTTKRGSGSSYYQWVRQHNFPEGYRVLCHNCNFAVSRGECPHQTETMCPSAPSPSQ